MGCLLKRRLRDSLPAVAMALIIPQALDMDPFTQQNMEMASLVLGMDQTSQPMVVMGLTILPIVVMDPTTLPTVDMDLTTLPTVDMDHTSQQKFQMEMVFSYPTILPTVDMDHTSQHKCQMEMVSSCPYAPVTHLRLAMVLFS